jgi:hypothetical protein
MPTKCQNTDNLILNFSSVRVLKIIQSLLADTQHIFLFIKTQFIPIHPHAIHKSSSSQKKKRKKVATM